jgi:hypothetical protein
MLYWLPMVCSLRSPLNLKKEGQHGINISTKYRAITAIHYVRRIMLRSQQNITKERQTNMYTNNSINDMQQNESANEITNNNFDISNDVKQIATPTHSHRWRYVMTIGDVLVSLTRLISATTSILRNWFS